MKIRTHSQKLKWAMLSSTYNALVHTISPFIVGVMTIYHSVYWIAMLFPLLLLEFLNVRISFVDDVVIDYKIMEEN